MVSSPVDPSENRVVDAPLTHDSLYRLLSDRRRRTLLYRLSEHEHPVDLAELARTIAIEETELDGEVPSEAIRHVRISLYHVHVPKLSNAGAVTFDRADRTVELLDDGRALLHRLEALDPT